MRPHTSSSSADVPQQGGSYSIGGVASVPEYVVENVMGCPPTAWTSTLCGMEALIWKTIKEAAGLRPVLVRESKFAVNARLW